MLLTVLAAAEILLVIVLGIFPFGRRLLVHLWARCGTLLKAALIILFVFGATMIPLAVVTAYRVRELVASQHFGAISSGGQQWQSSVPAAVASAIPIATPPLDRSCRQFVRSFYDWYVSRASMPGGVSESDALRYKKSVFSEQLFRALDADNQAQARSTRIVGLDFDPFFNAQFTSTHYNLGNLYFINNRCFAPVYFASPGPNMGHSSVVPELGLQNGRWVFLNFHFGTSNNDDLLSILRSFGFDH
jgi:hypothetical protein